PTRSPPSPTFVAAGTPVVCCASKHPAVQADGVPGIDAAYGCAMPERAGATVEAISPRVLARMPLPDYGATASKVDRGKLLLVAGSTRLPGAALLAALAALRVGCGTVRLAAPERIALHLGVAQPELMVIPLPESRGRPDGARGRAEIERQYD